MLYIGILSFEDICYYGKWCIVIEKIMKKLLIG